MSPFKRKNNQFDLVISYKLYNISEHIKKYNVMF